MLRPSNPFYYQSCNKTLVYLLFLFFEPFFVSNLLYPLNVFNIPVSVSFRDPFEEFLITQEIIAFSTADDSFFPAAFSY